MTHESMAAMPPVPTAITIQGETIELSPLRVGELPAMVRVLQPMADELGAEPDWIGLITRHGDRVIEAIALGARRPVDWVRELMLDQAVRLADAVFEVNADFFLTQLVPEIARVGQRFETRIGPLTGAISSTG